MLLELSHASCVCMCVVFQTRQPPPTGLARTTCLTSARLTVWALSSLRITPWTTLFNFDHESHRRKMVRGKSEEYRVNMRKDEGGGKIDSNVRG